jgi:Family of unknown function (DUF6204)
MTTRTVRVTVRGAFDGLTAEQRAELLARQPQHDFLHATYTREGNLTYDIAARPFFTFRFLTSAEDEQQVPDAVAQAELDAVAWLDEHGYGYKGLKSHAEDMSQAPVGARQRRAAR